MGTTIESTFPYQSGLELSVSPRWQPQLFRDLTELQMYRAQPALQAQAMRMVKVNAANAKDTQLRAAVAMVLDIKRKTIITDKGWRDRASFIRDQLEGTPVGYGLPADYADTARERDIRLIREVLHAWEKINGLYRKSVPHD